MWNIQISLFIYKHKKSISTLVLNFFSINVFQKLQLYYSMDRQCWELSFDIKTFKFDLIVCSEIGKISQISTCVFKN